MALFQQQGEVDWVAMSNSVLSNSLLIAQRLAAAGISQLTHHAGLALCSKFQLGYMGHIRVSDALSNLRPYYGFEKTLWFGFGHKSFLTLLIEQDAGFNCAALCASLVEAFGSDKAAHLLQALWRINGLSRSLEPSRSQFRALVNVCAGLLVATPFPEVLRRMAGPYINTRYHPSFSINSMSKDLAKAIDGIFRISRGDLRAIRIYGSRDLAFLGAIAHWLFDLSVWIELPDGTTTFTNCLRPEQAHVCLHYADMEESDALIQITATTFTLRTVEDLITDELNIDSNSRIKWDSCLHQLLDGDLQDILDEASLLGSALGAIARIYEAINSHEYDVGGLSRTHFTNFPAGGHGAGFIHSICNLLPEIGDIVAFRDAARQSLRLTIPGCTAVLTKTIRELIVRCSCSVCNTEGCHEDYPNCKFVVLLFIRTIGDIMAHVNLKASISPTRDDLETILNGCGQQWTVRVKEAGKDWSFHELATGLPHKKSSQGKNSTTFLLDGILQGVTQIFVNHGPNTEFLDRDRFRGQPQCTALTKNGVCIWIDALRDLTTINAANLATIHVAPGLISYNDNNYTSIWDLSQASTELLSSLPQAVFVEAPVISPVEGLSQPRYTLHIAAEERTDSGTIKLVYEVHGGDFGRSIQPGIITEEILAATARVPCSRTEACSDKVIESC